MSAVQNIGVLLAGGVGARLGQDMPKQFVKVAGKTVLEHAVDLFETHPGIDQIVVVVHPHFMEAVAQLRQDCQWAKVSALLPGGAQRYDSSLAAIRAFASYPHYNLIFHDVARPLLDAETLGRVVDALQANQAVAVAVPSSDTLFETNDLNDTIVAIPNRNRFWRAQTPQAFRQEIIAQAYERALATGALSGDVKESLPTDDCSLLMQYMPHVPVRIICGKTSNIKLTYKEDLLLMELLLQERDAVAAGENV